MKCCIIGSGTWGTALGQVLCDNHQEVVIYGRNEDEVNDINFNHLNSKYFSENVVLSPSLKATTCLDDALLHSDVIVLAVPTIALRPMLNKIKPLINGKPYFVSVAKGFDPDTLMRMSEVIRSVIPLTSRKEVVSLIGPGHAEEVIMRKLTCITSTCLDKKVGQEIQKLFSNEYLRVYYQDDEIGAEYGAALKNAIAIASGISQGLGMGDNAKAALVTRGLVEMTRFGIIMGGRKETFIGLTGIGDLMVTCNSVYSRNYQAGLAIGKANSAAEFLKTNTKTVEGIRTAQIVHQLAKIHNVEMPIVEATYQVLFENLEPKTAIHDLMMRKLKDE